VEMTDIQGIAGLDCWIDQSRLKSNLVDWIVIGFGLDLDWIWIVNHIFMMDLDWIDNPK